MISDYNHKAAKSTHKNQADNCNYRHEGSAALAQSQSIQLDKGLRSIQGEQNIKVRGTK